MISNKAIGGYLELGAGANVYQSFHESFYAVNSGRNALVLLLLSKGVKELYVPYYTCDVIFQCLKEINIQIKYYHVNQQFEIVDTIPHYAHLLYNNYFGVKDKYIEVLSKGYENLIVDNAQAFFSKPINGVDTFYSPRKFLGVPDGGFLFAKFKIDLDKYPQDKSYGRCSHLLKRIDLSAEEGYDDFRKNDKKIDGLPIKQMSKLTKVMLSQVDYEMIKIKRQANFQFLHKNLNALNLLDVHCDSDSSPLVYPLLLTNGNVTKKELIHKRIFIATYWPGLGGLNRSEFQFTDGLLCLPIDQRYEIEDMRVIIDAVRNGK